MQRANDPRLAAGGMAPTALPGNQMAQIPQGMPIAQQQAPQAPPQAPSNVLKHVSFVKSLMELAKRIPDVDPGEPMISKLAMKASKHEGKK